MVQAQPPNWWPKEHGAYAQLLMPLASLSGLAGLGGAAVAFGAAAVTAFFAHEALALAAGLRGSRARQAFGVQAKLRAWGMGGSALVMAGLGLALAPPLAWWSCAGLAVGVGLTGVLVWVGWEKSLPGELWVAGVLVSAGLPGALASGLPLAFALQVVAMWWLTFGLGICSVHGLLRQARGAGQGLRRLSGGLGAVAIGAGIWLGLGGWSVAWALLPPGALSLALPWSGVGARRLKQVGWSMVAADSLAFAWLLALGAPSH